MYVKNVIKYDEHLERYLNSFPSLRSTYAHVNINSFSINQFDIGFKKPLNIVKILLTFL